MRLDSSLAFVPATLSLVAAAGVAVPSTNVIDLLGSGVGTAPLNIIGNATTFGADMGVGGGFAVPTLEIILGEAVATGTVATLNVALQMAPDTGVGGGYLPGAWQTIVESGPMTAAQLAAPGVIARLDWAPNFPANLSPRFARLLFQTPAGTFFTAGSISYAGPTLVRDDQANKFAAANYKVA